MPDYLPDSNVLIRQLRRHQSTTDLLAALILEGEVGIATITRTEIIEGIREREREKTLRLLDSIVAYSLTAEIADQAGDYIRRYRGQRVILSKPDALIGATVAHHELFLATYNTKHFPMPDVRLYEGIPG